MAVPNNDRRYFDWRFAVALVSALFMPLLMLLLGVWIEQKFSQIDDNEANIAEIKKVLPDLLELMQTINDYEEGIATLDQVQAELREIRMTEETIRSVQQVINARVDNFGVRQAGFESRVELLDERLDTMERKNP